MRHFSRLLLLLAPASALLAADISFEPNRGQAGDDLSFFTRASGGVVFFTRDGAVTPSVDAKAGFEVAGANPHASWEPFEPTGHTTSYYIGRDPRRWVKDAPHYRRLTRRNVYDGVDVTFYGSGNRLEYDFLLAPHADPSRIRLRLRGATKLEIGADGALIADTITGQARQRRPVIFETLPDGSKRPVDGAFRIASRDEVAFTVGAHDPDLALSIDPLIELSTYIGGGGEDKVVATDGSIVVGSTTSIDVPGAPFARRKGVDIFVRYSDTQTFVFGGSGDDQVTSASFGAFSGSSVLIGGYTNSLDLPTNLFLGRSGPQPAPWQPDYAGGATDGFVLYLSFTGSSLFGYMTYIGTPGDDRITGVVLPQFSSNFAAVGTTSGHGLPQPTSGYSPFQSDLAGGTDGFFLSGFISTSSASLLGVTYLGGSGDDTALAVTGGGNSVYYVTGETKSADFPLTGAYSSQRSGDSDAFVARIGTANGAITLDRATLFGGSGSDRGVALSIPQNSPLLVAGVTSSPDLPLANPIQAAYGGGASDAFFAQFTADLSQLTSSTYYGGSAADEATSVAADVNGNLFLGGWTSSHDFPAKNALQPQFGGGPDDGFLLHLDADGSLYQATYFGGSGSDRVLSLYAPGGPTVWLVGSTTSPDLPTQSPSQIALAGPSDGWMARVTTNLINAASAIGAKDMRTTMSALLGNAAAAVSAPLTVASSDPAKVIIAADASEPGQASVLIPAQGASGRYFYADCLVDSGGADLTLSAPGYPDRIAHVSCFPASVSILFGPGVSTPGHLNLWSQPTGVTFYLVAVNPGDPTQIFYNVAVRPGAPPVTLQISNSNPQVGALSASTVMAASLPNSSSGVTFTPLATGKTTLSATSPALAPTVFSQLTVTVDPPVGVSQGIAIPAGFQNFLSLLAPRPPDANLSVTVTSQDASRLVVALDASLPGSSSVSVPYAGIARWGVWAQALAASGDVPITIDVPGQDTVSTTIHLSSPQALLNSSVQSLSLTVGQTTPINAYIGAADGRSSAFGYVPNPGGDPIRFALRNSNATAFSVTPAVAELAAATNVFPQATFQVQGLAEGTGTLTLQTQNSIPAASPPLSVLVKKRLLTMAGIEVGKDLAAVMTLTASPGTTGAVTLTSSNPALALLSPDSRTPGQAQIGAAITSSQQLSFYVYGLAATGQASVTASVAGAGSVTAAVQLDPSGFGWSADHYSATLYSPAAQSVAISSFALDPVSGIPVGAQGLRPGVSATVAISSANPDVATANTGPLTLNAIPLQITGKSSGETVLSFTQPAGFTTPAIRQLLPVKILTPSLSLSPVTLGKNMQTPFQLQLSPLSNLGLPMTLTSGDPSKLLISPNANTVGSGSVTTTTSGVVYLQALDSQGTVAVNVSVPTFNDAATTVRLASSGVGLTVENNSSNLGSTLSKGQYYTTPQSPSTRVSAGYYSLDPQYGPSGRATPRAGLGTVMANVTSSNPAVGAISGSPFRIPTDGTPASFDFTPLTVGMTNVTVSQPTGFTDVAGAGTLAFNVTTPALISNNNLVLAKDTFAQTDVSLPQNVKPSDTNVTVTLSSSDPDRLLLSPNATTAPTAAITRTLVAGNTSLGGFYAHALGNSGAVTIHVSAPGFADNAVNIVLADLAFGFEIASVQTGTPVRAVIQNGPQGTRLQAYVIFPPGLPAGYGTPGAVIRPGAAGIVVKVTSSDPDVVAIATPEVVFNGGASSMGVAFQPLLPGTATLSVSVPAGYLVHPMYGQLAVSAVPSRLSSSGGVPVGRDLQTSIAVISEDQFRQGTSLTVTSADPSRLLVSADANTAGLGSLTLGVNPNAQPTVFLQSLSDNGTVSIAFSADGYQPSILPVQLVPSAAVFQNAQTQNVAVNSGVQRLPVSLVPLDPNTLSPQLYSLQNPRPGSNITVALTSSAPKVLAVATPSLRFAVGQSSPTADVQPLSAGTAILSLGLAPGGVAPAAGSQIVFNVK